MLYMRLLCVANLLSSHNVCWASLGQLLIFHLIHTTTIASTVYLGLVAYNCVLLPTAVLCYEHNFFPLHLLHNTILAAWLLCTLPWLI